MRTKHVSDSSEKLNELTSSLEDLKTTVEELQIDRTTDLDPASLESVKDGLTDAMAATDEMEDQEEDNDTAPNK